MNKNTIGIVFIITGVLYSLLAWDAFYNVTLGKLVEHDFIKVPQVKPGTTPNLGRKATILLYGFGMIVIGVYLIFLSNI